MPDKIAPPFSLPDSLGVVHTLDDFLARGPLLLAFHRGTWWPNARRRFGELAEHHADYLARGVSTAAILAQDPQAVREYLAKRPLPFPVLIDGSREVSKAYGVWHRIGIDAWNIARPALFLMARDRSMARTFVARKQTEFPGHDEIQEWISALGA